MEEFSVNWSLAHKLHRKGIPRPACPRLLQYFSLDKFIKKKIRKTTDKDVFFLENIPPPGLSRPPLLLAFEGWEGS
jgi:hypothetical protein